MLFDGIQINDARSEWIDWIASGPTGLSAVRSKLRAPEL
jgi:hypothetical protein